MPLAPLCCPRLQNTSPKEMARDGHPSPANHGRSLQQRKVRQTCTHTLCLKMLLPLMRKARAKAAKARAASTVTSKVNAGFVGQVGTWPRTAQTVRRKATPGREPTLGPEVHSFKHFASHALQRLLVQVPQPTQTENSLVPVVCRWLAGQPPVSARCRAHVASPLACHHRKQSKGQRHCTKGAGCGFGSAPK